MIPTAIEAYAQHCQFKRASQAIDDRPDFKVYIVESIAYAQPLNARARDFLAGFDVNYVLWKPIRLSAYDLDVLTDYVKEGKIKITMENVELPAI